MKNRWALFSMMLVVFFATMVGLCGCGDKYQNLKITIYGAELKTDAETNEKYFELEYDDKDSSNNILSFRAVIEGYDDSMRTGLRISAVSEKYEIVSSNVFANSTTFTVKVLTSGIIPLVVYSEETSTVFAKFEIRSLLKAQSIADKENTLILKRPTVQDEENVYELKSEELVSYMPANATARGVSYALQNEINGVRIEGSRLIVSSGAEVGVLPIVVKSNRIVKGTSEYDSSLTEEEQQKLSTIIYAFIYDEQWKIQLFANGESGETNINTLKLSTESSNYLISSKLVSGETEDEQAEQQNISNVYAVFSATSQDETIAQIEKSEEQFSVSATNAGTTKISFKVELYYVPNLIDGQVIRNVDNYRKLATFEKDLDVEVIQTVAAIQITNSAGYPVLEDSSINVFKAQVNEGSIFVPTTKAASVTVNLTPSTLLDRHRLFVVSVEEGATDVPYVYYYNENSSPVVLISPTENAQGISQSVFCGENGVKIYIAYASNTSPFKLTFSSVQTTDVPDVVKQTITCTPKEAVKQISGVAKSVDAVQMLTIPTASETYNAYFSLDDATTGVDCVVIYSTETQENGAVINNQTFMIQSNNPEVISVEYVDGLANFKLIPHIQGMATITIYSENDQRFVFNANAVVGINTFGIGYKLESGAIGDVSYYQGEALTDKAENNVLTYGLKSIYLQTNSRIQLTINEAPTNASINYANGRQHPFSITGSKTSVNIEAIPYVDHQEVFLTVKNAGEYTLSCEVIIYSKNENDIWYPTIISTTTTIKVFTPIDGIRWNINGTTLYDVDVDSSEGVKIFDIDSLAYDKQPTFEYPNVLGGPVYFLSRAGLESFLNTAQFNPAGVPVSLNGGLLTDNDHVFFNAEVYSSSAGVNTNYFINNETIDGITDETVKTAQEATLHYSIDFSGISLRQMATIWGEGANIVEYEGTNSTQAYSHGGVWLAFTTVLDSNSAAARAEVYEYKITVLIVQAKNITKRSTFTLYVVQPNKFTEFDTVDEVVLEDGGIKPSETSIVLNNNTSGLNDSRIVYKLGGKTLTFEQISGFATAQNSAGTYSISNNDVTFDLNASNNANRLALIDGYAGGNKTTTLTMFALDSMAVARNVPTDEYFFATVSQTPVTGGENIEYVENEVTYYLNKVDAPNGQLGLVWVCFDTVTESVVGLTTTLPVYKTINININSGDTPNTAFKITNKNEFQTFMNSLSETNTFNGKYVEITKELLNVDLSNVSSNAKFEGVLFAKEQTNITITNYKNSIFGIINNASLQNLTFNFNNAVSNSTITGLLASIITFDAANNSSVGRYVLNETTGAYDLEESTAELINKTIIYRYGLFNVKVNVNKNIATTGNFGIFAAESRNAEFTDCEIVVDSNVSISAEGNLGGFVFDDQNGTFNHCVLRLLGGQTKIQASQNLGAIICNTNNTTLNYGYVLAFERTEDLFNIIATNVSGMVYEMNNSTISHCFVSACLKANNSDLVLNPFAKTFVGTNKIEYAFANVWTNNIGLPANFSGLSVTANEVYSFNSRAGVAPESNVYGSTASLNDFSASHWTNSYVELNDGLPLLKNKDGSLLYDKITPEINCAISADAPVINFKNENDENKTKLLAYVGKSVLLKDLIDVVELDGYYVNIKVPTTATFSYVGSDGEKIADYYKKDEISKTELTFNQAGEWEIELYAADKLENKKTYEILVSYSLEEMFLSVNNNGNEIVLVKQTAEGAQTPKVITDKNEGFVIDVNGIENNIAQNVAVRYITTSSEGIVLKYINSDDALVWQAHETDSVIDYYFIDMNLLDSHLMQTDRDANISYCFVLNNKYGNNTYNPLIFENVNFVFNVQVLPKIIINAPTECSLRTNEELKISITVETEGTPTVNLKENNTNLLKIVSATVEKTTTFTITSNSKFLEKSTTVQLEVFVDGASIGKIIPVTILPTKVSSILTTYYQNGVKGLKDDSPKSNIITPGGKGILKIEVLYNYSNYDYLEVYSTTVQNTKIFFTQFYEDENGVIKEIPDGSVYDANGNLILQKAFANINNENETAVYYVSTYIPNTVAESLTNFFHIKINAKAKNYLEDGTYEIISAFDPVVEYLVRPGFVSKLNVQVNNKFRTLENKILVTAGQEFSFNLNGTVKNAVLKVLCDGLTISSSELSSSGKYYTSKTFSDAENNNIFYAKVGKGDGFDKDVVSFTIIIYQNDMEVQNEKFEFVIVKQALTNLSINSDGENNVFTLGTNTYKNLILKHSYYDATKDGEQQNKDWFEASAASNGTWYYNDDTLSANAVYEDFLIEENTIKILNDLSINVFRLRGVTENKTLNMSARFWLLYDNDGNMSFCATQPTQSELIKHIVYVNFSFVVAIVVDSSETEPLPINSVEDLKALNGKTGQYYMLTKNLVLEDWEPFELNVRNLDFNGHIVELNSIYLTNLQTSTTDDQEFNVGLFTKIGKDTTLRNLILDISKLVYVDATDKPMVNFGFVAGVNEGIVYNTDVLALTYLINKTDNDNSDTGGKYAWEDVFNYKVNNNLTFGENMEKLVGSSSQDSFNFNNSRLVPENAIQIFNQLEKPVSVFVLTGGYTKTISSLTTNIGGLVGVNKGYVTNSRVGRADNELFYNGFIGTTENITSYVNDDPSHNVTQPFALFAGGNVGGLCGQNDNTISSCYFNGGYVINTATYGTSSTKTAGVVAVQTEQARLFGSYAQASEATVKTEQQTYNGEVRAQGSVAGVVHTNGGLVENCFANIALKSSSGVGGLVFENEEDATIKTSISLSRIDNQNSVVSGVFVGVDTKQNIQNFGKIENCYYLEQQNVIVHPNEKAIQLTFEQLCNPSKYLYAFSLTQNENENAGFVWKFIPTTENDQIVSLDVSLIDANYMVYGMRKSDNSYYDELMGGSVGSVWGTKYNPIIITSVDDWNKYFNETENPSGTAENKIKYYRLVSDVDFSESYSKPSSVLNLSYAFITGNGLTIKNLSFGMEGEDEQTAQTDNFGLFAKLNNCNVSGLNINMAAGFKAGRYGSVGGLAGTIEDSIVSNINITTEENAEIIGSNFAGALAGTVKTSKLSNITSNVSVSASYIQQGADNANIAVFDGENAKTVSYAGGIAGALIGTQEKQTQAEFLQVSGSEMHISGEFAGGVVGLVDEHSQLANSKFELSPVSEQNTQRIASTTFVAGGLVAQNNGLIHRCVVDYSSDVQSALDKAALTATDLNTTLGSLALFGNNSCFAIGGLVGFNLGGGITDSYTRAEVINKKAIVAGGFVGVASAKTFKFDVDGNIDLGSVTGTNPAISALNRVYTTSMVYAKTYVGGLVGALGGSVHVEKNPTILALNKIPVNPNYDYAVVPNKGSVIGFSKATGSIVKDYTIKPDDNTKEVKNNYSGSKFGIYAITQTNATANETKFEQEIGNLSLSAGDYEMFVETYDVAYLNTIKNDAIVFSGFAAESDVWVVDDARTEHILPTLLTNRKPLSGDIEEIDDWNKQINNKFSIKNVFTITKNLDETQNGAQAFARNINPKNVTLQGDASKDIKITVKVDDQYQPLFNKAEGLTLNNIEFEFNVKTSSAINISSLLCAQAINCTFNNVKIKIINPQTTPANILTLKADENYTIHFGAFVGKMVDVIDATGETDDRQGITIYNCSIDGIIKIENNKNIVVGGLVGSIEGTKTVSSITSTNFGNIQIILENNTETQNVSVGGVVGSVLNGTEIRGNVNTRLTGSLENTGSSANIGGLVGQASGGANINSASVSLGSKGTDEFDLIVEGPINLGGVVGYADGITIINASVKNEENSKLKLNLTGDHSLTEFNLNFGGIVANLVNSTLKNSISNVSCEIKAKDAFVGGLVGNCSGIIDSCVSAGSITILNGSENLNDGSENLNVGSIAGKSTSQIKNCAVYTEIYAQASQLTGIEIGGIVGSASGTIWGTVAYGSIVSKLTNCVVSGAVAKSEGASLTNVIVATQIISTLENTNAISAGTANTNVYYVPNMIGLTATNGTEISIANLTNVNSSIWRNFAATLVPADVGAIAEDEEDLELLVLPVSSTIKTLTSRIENQSKLCFVKNKFIDDIANVFIDEQINNENTISLNENTMRVVSDGIKQNVTKTLFNTISEKTLVSGLHLNFVGTQINIDGNTVGLLANTNNGLIFDCSLGEIINEPIKDSESYKLSANSSPTDSEQYYHANNYNQIEIVNSGIFGGLVGNNAGIVLQNYVYADFIIPSGVTFGGIAGNNAGVVAQSYVIGRQVLAKNKTNPEENYIVGTGIEKISDCFYYVTQYYNDTVVVNKTDSTGAISAVWMRNSNYNYGIPMFARYYNNSNLRSAYITGNGTESEPYEIIEFDQLITLQKNIGNGSGYFVLAKDLAVYHQEGANYNWKYHLNGNGHSLRVRNYNVLTSANTAFGFGVFNEIEAFASVQNVNIILPARDAEHAVNAKYFGGLAVKNNSNYVQNVSVLAMGAINLNVSDGAVFAGGMFAETSKSISKCWTDVQFSAFGSGSLYAGGISGIVNTNNLTFSKCFAKHTLNLIGSLEGNKSIVYIDSCYASADVAGVDLTTLNFVGNQTYTTSSITITNSYLATNNSICLFYRDGEGEDQVETVNTGSSGWKQDVLNNLGTNFTFNNSDSSFEMPKLVDVTP